MAAVVCWSSILTQGPFTSARATRPCQQAVHGQGVSPRCCLFSSGHNADPSCKSEILLSTHRAVMKTDYFLLYVASKKKSVSLSLRLMVLSYSTVPEYNALFILNIPEYLIFLRKIQPS